MKVAIIDLGTNTCNLLIAKNSEDSIDVLYSGKQLVRMGDAKITDNLISDESTERVLAVLNDQRKIIESLGVEKVRILATSAVRMAKNKSQFLSTITRTTGYPVEVVTGEREAELIFKGVLLALGRLNDKSLILDIGGGSNELIIAHHNQMIWHESKPTGMARITNQFVLSDPLKPEEIQILQNFFSARHQEAFRLITENGVNTLIGCSGSFDTIADILDQVDPGEKQRDFQEIPLEDFYKVHSMLIHSTRKQREKIKGMDSVRVDLIVPAMVFIDQIIKQAGIAHIIQTGNSLREGVLYEMVNSKPEVT